MPKLGVSFCPEIIEHRKDLPLVKTIEVSFLNDLMLFDGDWTFHFRKENPFDGKSASLHLLKPLELQKSLESPSLKALLQLRPPKIVSFHLGHSVLNIKKVLPDNHNEAIGPIPSHQEVFETFCQSLEIIRQSFLIQELHLPVAVENLDYHPGGAYEYICEPDFINAIFREFPNLYLLLDIAHAEISALALYGGCVCSYHRQETTKKYLRSLPLGRLIQIHINSPRLEGGYNYVAYDMHLPIQKTEVELLRDLLGLPNLMIVNLECTEDVRRQVGALSQIMKGGA